ncbi:MULTISPECIES: GntR family transcriptional regulator [Pantoea]|jgi:DNA-binding GntR family transcriptional regulator|uniref:DNA-binding transcriptional regulator, GntR family n=1 Tax=Candidatus Pantoea symbiotica TaxID=1884370 RepID=A0A1I4EAT2_9GAMM|nr:MULTISPECIES: GntR family transcriptional regulator [Pantoea]MRS20956.1 GntR family transcriptional regulator [Enterobacteriaceae bacterium RIT692]MRT26262.1 GntR family transcriptional regulator [Enterobacteriaceae bacterium RIT697]KAJ9431397.1 GntR family transcriptional regulator [Pantoea sp. YR343]UVC29193.1 GntR family transcriptional regulator [Pantoea sp. SOD02]SFL02383.1 DNA-binding transcriptional regulator, GntR family [Pantoea symbiotica]
MSRSQNLRQNVINQMLEGIAKRHIRSPLPPQAALAEMFNISRTTVRHTLQHLHERGVLEKVDETYVIVRDPSDEDGFNALTPPIDQQALQFEQTFFNLINQRQLMPGDTFSELQLAQQVKVSPIVVREFLLRFMRYDLLEPVRRGQWRMKKFDQKYAENLFELREMLETHALTRFLNLPSQDERWMQARDLLDRHRSMRDTIASNYRHFAALDKEMHTLILSAANNPFFNQSLEIISVIFHSHYQWDETDLKQRNIVALEEHMAILTALISRQDVEALCALHNHLGTAKTSMIRSIRQYN